MTTYTDIRDNVYTWTNRPNLTAETDIAIRQAVRAAHRSGSFWRDLVELPLTSQPTTAVQQLDLSSLAPLFRNLAYIKPTGVDNLFYKEVTIGGLLDQDGYLQQDVYYGVGTYLNIRAATPVDSLTMVYYKNWTVSPITSLDSWIAVLHPDLIALWAAATILSMIGEQEIKSRVNELAKMELDNLIEDATGIARR